MGTSFRVWWSLAHLNASPDLVSAILVELASIQDEMNAVHPLLFKLKRAEPDEIELRAVGATLHSFYTGIERILLLVANHLDESVPNSPRWHRDLISQMSRSTNRRAEILSSELALQFTDYLAFRHVFRHSYSNQLRWTLMRPLVDLMPTTLESFRSSLHDALGV
jgi:hypothetical protein